MSKSTVSKSSWKRVRFVGIDLGDKRSQYCGLDEDGEVVGRGSFSMDERALRSLLPSSVCCVAIEVGTYSAWVSGLLEEEGHDVVVANARKVRLIFASGRKNDRLDAENLARLLHLQPALLHPITHRGRHAQADLVVIKSRDVLVRERTRLVNRIRGVCKSFGVKLPSCSAASFVKKAHEHIPEDLWVGLEHLFNMLLGCNENIRALDRKIDKIARTYPEVERVKQVNGVGTLTALAFVLTLEDPRRFRRSRQVGAYLGLTAKQDDSGESRKQLGITKQGDTYLRRLLVTSAHYILGPFGKDCDLRRHGMRIAERGGMNAKKRAVVAVARKLSVLLHRLWISGEEYVPIGYQPGRHRHQQPAA